MYFIILIPLCYLLAVLTPVWLGALDLLPTSVLDVTGYLIYILCALGSFTIPSILLFFRQKSKNAGRLTHRNNVTLLAIAAGLFVVLATYAILTFLLPLLVDYPASCCPGCPSAFVCWVGLPMPTGLFTTLMVSFVVLSGVSLPFFILWGTMLLPQMKLLKRKKGPQ